MNTPLAHVDHAMRLNSRARFLPAEAERFAGSDHPLPIGYGQTNSQPTTVRNMIELLDVRPGHNVLDLGSGSGWTSAILGTLVGDSGRVTAVEIVPELVERSRAVLSQTTPNVTVVQATPGVLGAPHAGQFDRILVSAEATVMPGELVTQLAEGGVMVVPVAGEMLKVRRRDAGDVVVTRHGHYLFVPLIEPGD